MAEPNDNLVRTIVNLGVIVIPAEEIPGFAQGYRQCLNDMRRIVKQHIGAEQYEELGFPAIVEDSDDEVED